MTALDLQVLLPLLTLVGTALGLLLVAAFHESRVTSTWIAIAGQIAALTALTVPARHAPHEVGTLLRMDSFALFYMGLILVSGIAVTVLSQPYLVRCRLRHEEFHIVLLLASVGAVVLVASTHFAAFFLGLELLTVSLYVLIGYDYRRAEALEAAVKYLILAALSSAFLLFGMALIYAEVGALEFHELAKRLAESDHRAVFILAGTGFLVVGVGFKLAVVPFHFWTPDVYEGAPAPVTAFVATISKGAVVALLLRYSMALDLWSNEPVFLTFGGIAAASMLAGNVLALLQDNVKRMIAYGSIGHLGYVLVALLAGGAGAAEAVTFYLAAYMAATLGVFGLIGHGIGHDREATRLDDFCGLFWRQPALAGMCAVFLLSLVGLPLTGGFLGKFLVVRAGIATGLWLLVLLVVATTVVGLFYYFRVIAAMFSGADESLGEGVSARTGRIQSVPTVGVLALLSGVVVWLGVYPRPLLEWIERVVAPLAN